MSEDEYVTAVEVKHYAYCPRIVYFTHVLHLHERLTEAMEAGREAHDESMIAPLIPKLKASKVLKVPELASEGLRLKGKPDYIIVTKHGEYIPIEVKWAEPTKEGGVKRDHKLQLAAYALLIEDAFKVTVKRAAVHYTRANKLYIIPITPDLKREARNTIQDIHRIILSEEPPAPTRDLRKCENCGFKQYCMPPLH
ncbi:MAG: CRISPR-associated protein Cas4 [Thermoprotei archaeon]|nr:MAG: CRISPR-associated protein Cas4 [Thermoprotei archaeon]